MGNQRGPFGSNLQGNNMSGNPLKDPRSPLSRREIFYDYDSFVVKDEYKPLLEAHAAYLKSNRNARVTVEGNTDERGSREYNLALGQKRSESVKRVLTLLGVNEAQIETVSFGEENRVTRLPAKRRGPRTAAAICVTPGNSRCPCCVLRPRRCSPLLSGPVPRWP